MYKVIIKGSWEAIFRVTDDFYSSDFTSHNNTCWKVVLDFTSHNNTSRGVVWDFTPHNNITIHQGKWWLWWRVVTKGSGDLGKWWRREYGYFAKWWLREVVTLVSCDFGKWWLQWLHECCMGHGVWVGGNRGHETLCFFEQSGLQAAMKGTLCVRRVRVRSYWARFRFSLGVLQCVVVHVCSWSTTFIWPCGFMCFWHLSCRVNCFLTLFMLRYLCSRRHTLLAFSCIFVYFCGLGGWGGVITFLSRASLFCSNLFLELQTGSSCYASNMFLELQTRSWCYASNMFLGLQTRSWCDASNMFLELQTRSWCAKKSSFVKFQNPEFSHLRYQNRYGATTPDTFLRFQNADCTTAN